MSVDTASTTTSFTTLLLERGLITESDQVRAIEVCQRSGGRLPETFVRLGLVAEPDMAHALADAAALSVVVRDDMPSELPVLPGLNRRFLVRRNLLPIQIADDRLVVAIADPSDTEALEGLAFATGYEIEPRVTTFSDIQEVLARESDGVDDLAGLVGDLRSGADGDLERLAEGDSEAPIIRLVQRLLAGAAARRASDVHLEPMARYLAVRYRIDGRLVEVERLPDAFGAPVASRIKVLAGLDIAESRLPQDGRLRLTVRGREIDVRVSTSPTAWGESIVLRLLGRTEVPLDLEKLGLHSLIGFDARANDRS
jgi:general secretion pathway protein E